MTMRCLSGNPELKSTTGRCFFLSTGPLKQIQRPSGKHTKNYGKIKDPPFSVVKSTINGHVQ